MQYTYPSKKIISMSLYGDSNRYLEGAKWNAEHYQEYFPGWALRIYYARGMPVGHLKSKGCEIIAQPPGEGHMGMFWRFLAVQDPDAEFVIIRDIDSKLNEKDAAAVQAWLQSGLCAHVMKDHRAHKRAMLAGMWGIKGQVITNMDKLIAQWVGRWRSNANRCEQFLEKMIWPLIKTSCLIHNPRAGLPFPLRRSKITKHIGHRDF